MVARLATATALYHRSYAGTRAGLRSLGMTRVRSRDRCSSICSLVHQPPTVFAYRSYFSLDADCRYGGWIFEGPYFPAFAFYHLASTVFSYGTYVSLDTDC